MYEYDRAYLLISFCSLQLLHAGVQLCEILLKSFMQNFLGIITREVRALLLMIRANFS